MARWRSTTSSGHENDPGTEIGMPEVARGPFIHRSLDPGNTVIREQQIVLVLLFEDEILTAGDRLVGAFGDQRFAAARDVFTKLRSTIHLVALCEIRADREHAAKPDACAANGRVR